MTRPALLLLLSTFACFFVSAQSLKEKIQAKLDSFQKAGHYPAVSMAIEGGKLPGYFSSGYIDTVKKVPVTHNSMFLQGSVGKTYCAAILFKLIGSGKLSLDDKASMYLGKYAWFSRLPNAADLTIRNLMQHTSGVMRYEFKPAFTKDLTDNPHKKWKPEELLHYILDEKASFAAGTSWEYSDTNFIILGMIIEEITGKKYYTLVNDWLLQPFHLAHTLPSDDYILPGLAQGFAGPDNEFGGKDEMIASNGEVIVNPQFEWTGGGIYSTTTDLAKWCKLLYEGKVFSKRWLDTMELSAVPAKLGPKTEYGYGVIVRHHAVAGVMYGHSGFFPGYLTEAYYIPSLQTVIALQANSSNFKVLRGSLLRCMNEVITILME